MPYKGASVWDQGCGCLITTLSQCGIYRVWGVESGVSKIYFMSSKERCLHWITVDSRQNIIIATLLLSFPVYNNV